ncbi:MAG: DUF2293 domain-containing protein [Roseitalea sp.]|nr:DUF2293 domain-containing protein [Roseitalea sp.]MBO6951277.1 DUF2293 domain-containing protein [Rhizobiaceae bacterium]MBO6590736.1 DUF2293 domain-containing protein [Roseitalea sp.]MBO6600006.1 DUF2293 domain-containing protein [Roseitalea sp.]MBO6611762.1 DUF2293 domain-containing protein [Roseitalea sp.]
MPMTTKRQAAVSQALERLAPLMPLEDALAIKALVARPHMRGLPAQRAVWLATITHIRHTHSDYDALLDEGYDRDAARFFVLDEVNALLRQWQATRFLDADEDGVGADG